jgi:monoamine oxidase
MAAGKSVQVIEARPRIGGRTFTDNGLGFPVDLGAAWLTEGSPLLHQLGLATAPAVSAGGIVMNGKMLPQADYAHYTQARETFGKKVDLLAEKAPGLDPRLVLKPADALEKLALYELARRTPFAMELAAPDGLGAAVARFGASLGTKVPVKTGVRLVRVDSTGRLVSLITDHGEFAARTVIVTLPVGVLMPADRPAIGFSPPLRPARRAALEALNMTVYDKVAVSFTRQVFDLPADVRLLSLGKGDYVIDALVRPAGHEGAILLLEGDSARELETAGPSADGAWALSALAEIFGDNLRSAYRGARSSRWGHDRYAGGAWSMPKPGAKLNRASLAEPHHDRVLFAGEATEDGNRLDAAYTSGLRAAQQALATLK